MEKVKTDEVFQAGNVAVITGASSGIGRACSMMCAKHGMHVWMLDIDTKDLEVAVQLVQSKCIITTDDVPSKKQEIHSALVDVSKQEEVQGIAKTIFQKYETIHFLMNNAGIGLGGGPLTTNMEEFQRVMNVNLYGVIYGCQSFIPTMIEKGQPGIIVHTGSKQGITMPPGNLTYNVSKAALKTFAEGLEHDLRSSSTGKKLQTALLIPGWTNTSIHLKEQRERAMAKNETYDSQHAFFHEDKPAKGAWMPHQVINFMLEELTLGRFYIVCPDNDVTRDVDNIRMTWTMQDITSNRPPLSRWHPDYQHQFTTYLQQQQK